MEEQYNDFVSTASQMLSRVLIDHYDGSLEDAPQVDQELQELFRRVGAAAMEKFLNHFVGTLSRETTQAGIPVLRSPKVTYGSLFGPLEISSPYHYHRTNRTSARPALEKMGIEGGKRSDAVQRALCDFGAEESFAQAEKRFQEHYGWSPGESAIRETTERIARETEDYVASRLDEAQPLSSLNHEELHRRIENLLVELDGCEIRTGNFVTAEGNEKTPVRGLPKKKKETEWKDVRVGLIRELDEVCKIFVARQDPYPTVVGQMRQAALLKGMTEASQVIAVADGAPGLREELDVQFPKLQFILDRPHLKGHFYETAEELGFEGENKEFWVKVKMAQIDAGEVEKVLRLLIEQNKEEPHERLGRLIKYVEKFSDAVNYGEYKEKGYPIGSGEVESAHRSIPQKRLKLPGTWWHIDNLNPMLALRVLRANEWWNDFWKEKRQKSAA